MREGVFCGCVPWNGVSMMDSVGRITLAARKGRGKDAAKEVYIAAFPVLRAHFFEPLQGGAYDRECCHEQDGGGVLVGSFGWAGLVA